MGEWIWVMIPLAALMIPIVAIFSHHQQKMAQILSQNNADHGALAGLRTEIAELKTLIHSQAIALDNMSSERRSLPPPPPDSV